MNRLYRISALALAAALCLALAACGPKLPGTNSGSSSAVSTPAASGSGSVSGSASVSSGGAGDTMSEGQRYAYAIRDARPAEDNEYSEIACGDAGGEPMLAVNPNDMSAEDAASSIQMMLDTMGIDPATLDAYAFSMSMMNVRAYAIGVFKPAEGQAEAALFPLGLFVLGVYDADALALGRKLPLRVGLGARAARLVLAPGAAGALRGGALLAQLLRARLGRSPPGGGGRGGLNRLARCESLAARLGARAALRLRRGLAYVAAHALEQLVQLLVVGEAVEIKHVLLVAHAAASSPVSVAEGLSSGAALLSGCPLASGLGSAEASGAVSEIIISGVSVVSAPPSGVLAGFRMASSSSSERKSPATAPRLCSSAHSITFARALSLGPFVAMYNAARQAMTNKSSVTPTKASMCSAVLPPRLLSSIAMYPFLRRAFIC